ncbi:MAG TPA: AraC family transcriptional regulator [Treponema sp.]|nr:AraC family transcriptional regulator [Treponema sp.]
MAHSIDFVKRQMYYPIQIPHILNKSFSESIQYSEEIVAELKDFNICLWEMRPISNNTITVENIIVADGCIDLIVDCNGKNIGFAGMSKTNFNFKINMPNYFIGARLKPGAFHLLTNIPASSAMDNFLPITAFDNDFDVDAFFSLSYQDAKKFIKKYIGSLAKNKKPSQFMLLFDELNKNIPDSVPEIYKKLYYSERQCQRLFAKNYGLSPQMILCVLRFQNCLKSITSKNFTSKGILEASNYYDQSHFINDFKRNIGLTPFELLKKYTS